MSHILGGKKIKDEIKERLTTEFSRLPETLGLAIIQVGEREDSIAYINHKKKFGKDIGAHVEHFTFPDRTSEDQLISLIEKLNTDDSVHGIILQLPLPEYLDEKRIIFSIDSHKDVDGLTPHNIALLYQNKRGLVPATARGVVTLLDYYDIDIEGKDVVVIGRSDLAGKPIALSLLNRNATVTMCHSHTENLEQKTLEADIIIVATGVKHLIKKEHVTKDQIIIDVGIHSVASEKEEFEIPETKYTGDVDFDEVAPLVAGITPVPGGVGQLTVACLYENLLDAYVISRM